MNIFKQWFGIISILILVISLLWRGGGVEIRQKYHVCRFITTFCIFSTDV